MNLAALRPAPTLSLSYDFPNVATAMQRVVAGAGLLEAGCWLTNQDALARQRLPILTGALMWGALRSCLPDSRMLELSEGLAAGSLTLAFGACSAQAGRRAPRAAALWGVMAGLCGWAAIGRMMSASRPISAGL